MTVRDMLNRMGADEFAEWQAFETLEPFGPRREEYRMGTLISHLCGVNGVSVRPAVVFPELDPMAGVDESDPEVQAELVKQQMRALGIRE